MRFRDQYTRYSGVCRGNQRGAEHNVLPQHFYYFGGAGTNEDEMDADIKGLRACVERVCQEADVAFHVSDDYISEMYVRLADLKTRLGLA